VVDWRGEARGKILSNVILSQTAKHEVFGGVVPAIAARSHVETLDHVIAKALSDAGTSLDKIDARAAKLAVDGATGRRQPSPH
jgi:N6-L-threonylcarbamoyladenine synthase